MQKFLLLLLLVSKISSCGQKNNKLENVQKEIVKNHVDTSRKQMQKPISKPKDYLQYENDVNSMGIGLVLVPNVFEVYNDSLLTDKLLTRDIYSINETNTDIISKFFKPDYGIMHFVCIGTTAKSYKVLVNFSDYKFLPKTDKYEFKTWENYIIQSFGVRLKHNEIHQPLRKVNYENSDTLLIPKGFEMYCPIELKGDWLKVKYDCFYNQENNPHEGEPCYNYIDKCNEPITGWIKWKQENKLLIDIFLMP